MHSSSKIYLPITDVLLTQQNIQMLYQKKMLLKLPNQDEKITVSISQNENGIVIILENFKKK